AAATPTAAVAAAAIVAAATAPAVTAATTLLRFARLSRIAAFGRLVVARFGRSHAWCRGRAGSVYHRGLDCGRSLLSGSLLRGSSLGRSIFGLGLFRRSFVSLGFLGRSRFSRGLFDLGFLSRGFGFGLFLVCHRQNSSPPSRAASASALTRP